MHEVTGGLRSSDVAAPLATWGQMRGTLPNGAGLHTPYLELVKV